MTQGAVGAKLDPQHTRQNVCKWEHGQIEPSLATVEQLAKMLDVSPCWLAFGIDHRAYTSSGKYIGGTREDAKRQPGVPNSVPRRCFGE